MTENSLYTSHKNILVRLTSLLKTSGKTINERDVKRWCQEVEKEILGDVDNMYHYRAFPLTVANSRAWLPCNVYRILDVYDKNGNTATAVEYNNAGEFLVFRSDMTLTTIYIDYEGHPVDLETGLPLIIKGHENACLHYCLYMLHYEDILHDRISVDAKNRLEYNRGAELLAAMSYKAKNKSRRDLERNDAIMYDELPEVAKYEILGAGV